MFKGDILDNLARVRTAFIAARLNPPAAIYLGSNEDGMRLLSAVAKHPMFMAPPSRYGCPVEFADGSVFMECELMGMRVRWPANRRARPDGSWSYE